MREILKRIVPQDNSSLAFSLLLVRTATWLFSLFVKAPASDARQQ